MLLKTVTNKGLMKTKSRISDNAERAPEILQITGRTDFPSNASRRMKAEKKRWRQFVEERHQREAQKQIDSVQDGDLSLS